MTRTLTIHLIWRLNGLEHLKTASLNLKYLIYNLDRHFAQYRYDKSTVRVQYGYSTGTVRYSTGTVRYSTGTVRYSTGTVRLQYGTVRVQYGYSTVRYGYSTGTVNIEKTNGFHGSLKLVTASRFVLQYKTGILWSRFVYSKRHV